MVLSRDVKMSKEFRATKLFAIRDKEWNIISAGYADKKAAKKARDQMKWEHGKDYFVTIDIEHWRAQCP